MSQQIKTDKDIKIMKKAGKICAEALRDVLENIDVGVSLKHLDDIAKKSIEKNGAKSGFMTVDDYKWTICATVNDQVVHGIPTERKLQNGDILGIDIGAMYEGFHSDLAISVPVGKVSEEDAKFLDTGEKTLKKAIQKARAGNYIGDISSTIQKGIESEGYSVVTALTGHGVGRQLHEEPMVPGVGQPKSGERLEKNMVLAIEVIYTKGSEKIVLEDDGWTISSEDGSLGGLFEQTVQITNSGPIVLTPYL